MKNKLRDARGETLVELLISVLIGTLSIALLFAAVAASVNMDKKAKAADKAHNTVLNAAEKQETGTEVDPFAAGVAAADKKVTVENTSTDPDIVVAPPNNTADVAVNYYGGKGAISYALPSPP